MSTKFLYYYDAVEGDTGVLRRRLVGQTACVELVCTAGSVYNFFSLFRSTAEVRKRVGPEGGGLPHLCLLSYSSQLLRALVPTDGYLYQHSREQNG
jgi:hypothetical protein